MLRIFKHNMDPDLGGKDGIVRTGVTYPLLPHASCARAASIGLARYASSTARVRHLLLGDTHVTPAPPLSACSAAEVVATPSPAAFRCPNSSCMRSCAGWHFMAAQGSGGPNCKGMWRQKSRVHARVWQTCRRPSTHLPEVASLGGATQTPQAARRLLLRNLSACRPAIRECVLCTPQHSCEESGQMVT